jgi:hypothetical protein
MPPFQYQQPTYPLTNTIAGLMERQGEIPAEAARNIAAAQAQAQIASGQAWGGAISNIGQDVSQTINQQFSPENQLRRQQLQAYQQTQASMRRAGQIVAKYIKTNADGTKTLDPDRMPDMLQEFGLAGVSPEIQKETLGTIESVNKTIQGFVNDRTNRRADIAHAQLQSQAGQTPEGIAVGANLSWMNGLANADDLAFVNHAVSSAIARGESPTTVLRGIRAMSEKYRDIEKPITIPATPAGGAPARLVKPTGEEIATGGSAPGKIEKATFGVKQPDGTVQNVEGMFNPTANGGKGAYLMPDGSEAPAAMVVKAEAPKALPEQLVDAIRSGNEPARQNILKAMEQEAAAKRDTVAIANVQAMRELTMEQARQRIENADPNSEVNQRKMEQEYRQTIQREFSSRSGPMGMQDAKVNQALHLLGLLDQYEGKNMPAPIHAELALGLATLTSSTNSIGIELTREFKQRTAQEGISKAVAWLTGDPQLVNATPDALRQMYRESILRQGNIAQQEREGYFNAMKASAPTDLAPERKAKLEEAQKLNRVPAEGSPPSGTVRNGATFKNGAQGWGWYK